MTEQMQPIVFGEDPELFAAQLGTLLLQAARDEAAYPLHGSPESSTHPDDMWLNAHEQSLHRREILDGAFLAWPAHDTWQVPRGQFIHGTLRIHPTIKALRARVTPNDLAATYERYDMQAAWWTSLTLWQVPVPNGTPRAAAGYVSLLDFLHSDDVKLRDHAEKSSFEMDFVRTQFSQLPEEIISFYSDRKHLYRLFREDPELLDEFGLTAHDKRQLSSFAWHAKKVAALRRPLPTVTRPDNRAHNASDRQPAEVTTISAA